MRSGRAGFSRSRPDIPKRTDVPRGGAGDKMTAFITKAVIAATGNILYAFFTERMVSRIILEVLKTLAAKTSNRLDDEIIGQLEKSMNL